MPVVTIQPSGKTVRVASGIVLIDALRLAGEPFEAPCGGQGTCGRCAVRLIAGDAPEPPGAPPADLPPDMRRACLARVGEPDLTVFLPEAEGRAEDRDEESGDPAFTPDLSPDALALFPLAEHLDLAVPAPRPEDGLSDADRLERALRPTAGDADVVLPLPVLRALPDALRGRDGRIEAAVVREGRLLHVVDLAAGAGAGRIGAAIDLGTTTVSVQLLDLADGRVLATRSGYNDQIACGQDVISRINYAVAPDRLAELQARAAATINRLLRRMRQDLGLAAADVVCAVLSGNTVMLHLLLGIPPEYLRLAPYTPALLSIPPLTAAELGLDLHPGARVHCSPAVGSYVGGDITAGLLCTEMTDGDAAISLYIDIGTNGEIVLGNGDFLMTCACSAGPAFEGGGIDCGMRAADGAIAAVRAAPFDGRASLEVIGAGRPRGICGSGMIDLMAELFRHGWLEPSGRLSRARPSPAIVVEGRRARYLLAGADEGATGRPLAVSEADLENLLRAKAAVYSACTLLLAQTGIGFDDLARVYVAGGFGRHLNLENAVTIGLLPDLPPERFRYLGNASLKGSSLLLLSRAHRERQQALARRMTYVNLSHEPAYMDHYTAALFLPHTDAARFPSVAKR